MTMTLSGTTGGIGVIGSGTAVASTSGTSIDFTSLPAGLKRITVMFNGISTNGTSLPIVQVGAGSVTTSGYLCMTAQFVDSASPAVVSSTTGFAINAATGATYVTYGTVVLTLIDTNKWVASGTLAMPTPARSAIVAGGISLSGTLDRVRITTVNGTDAFDAGSINILYE